MIVSDSQGFPGIMEMMKQAREMSRRLAEVRGRLRALTFTATVGAEMVKATVTGTGEVVRIDIDPSLLKVEHKGVLEDLIASAVTEAVKKSKECFREEMSKLTGGVDVMGMLGLS